MDSKKACIIFRDNAKNEKAAEYSMEPLTLCDYHSYHRRTNPFFDTNSGLILDVKENKSRGIDHFTDILQSILSNDEYVICVIPPHKEEIKPSGIRSIAKKLCKPPVIDGTDLLYRIKECPKKTDTGIRDLTLELESLDIRDKDLIKGKQVLLLDDVTTSGVSLKAGKILLEKSGAELVVTCALGKTRS